MLKDLIFGILRPFLTAYALIRYGSIWGNNVYIGVGAKVIGGITIGDNCRIGANAVVYEDMPPNSVAVCAATRIISKDGEPLDNTYRTTLDGVDYVFQDGRLHRAEPS